MTDMPDRLHETVLVLRCQAGDVAAFEEIVARYGPRLNSTALSRIPLTSFQRGKPDAKIAEPLPSAFEVALSSLGVSLFGPGDLSGCLGQQLLL